MIVTVPVAFLLAVLPLITVPTTEKISMGSPMSSSVIGIDTVIIVWPTGIVMKVAVAV